MKKISTLAKLLAAGLALGAVTAANATPVVGKANLTFGLVDVSFGEIDWNPPTNPGLDATPTYGSFTTHPFSFTGSFAAVAGTAGSVQDMSVNPADANYIPIGVQPTPIENFLKFNTQPTWRFSLTNLAAGNIAGAPYFLTQLGSAVSATITVGGFVYDDTNNNNAFDLGEDKTNWTGVFSTQYTNTTIADLIHTILPVAQGGLGESLSNNTWSATIEATVPEPGSLALVGLAMAGIGAFTRRRKA